MSQYTINELTSIFKVSKQSIYNFINKDKALLKEHSTRIQRKIYYDDTIFSNLVAYYGLEEAPKETDNTVIEAVEQTAEVIQPTPEQINQQEEIDALKAEIEALKLQLKESDEKIKKLIDSEQEAIKQNSQILLLLQEEKQEKMKLLPSPDSEKKPLWKRIFKR